VIVVAIVRSFLPQLNSCRQTSLVSFCLVSQFLVAIKNQTSSLVLTTGIPHM
jgi:hypothetical protein